MVTFDPQAQSSMRMPEDQRHRLLAELTG